jgi:hypothetical protein
VTTPGPEHRKVPLAADAPILVTPMQAVAFQDLQLKTDPGKASDIATPRADVARVAAPEAPALAEKTTTQPLKSVSLEFTPDGARDVKVRLSERGGEVHVSVHSSDAAVTKNLRAGVTDLASVLADAGYDAKTWTSARQQQEHSQQQQEPVPQRKDRRGIASGDTFDGILQQGASPITQQENV